MNVVRKSIFSTELKGNWEETLDNLKTEIKDLKDDEDMEMSCTPKFHILIFHVKQWCQTEIERAEMNQVAPRGLGKVSAQTSESMHGKFEKDLEHYSPNWSNPRGLLDDLFNTTTSWAGKVLWPQEDGDQN